MKEFIPDEQALALKELGFDKECFAYFFYNGAYSKWVLNVDNKEYEYSNTIKAPTFSQAFRFFREKYGYLPNIHNFNGNFKATLSGNCNWLGSWTKTYEEAELACLKKLIEIVKNK